MKVRALQPGYYAQQQREPGDEYEMDDREEKEAKVLAALGKIEILGADDSEQPKQRQPEPPQEPPKSPAQPMTTENTAALVPPKEGE
jgi:hypothetical protein